MRFISVGPSPLQEIILKARGFSWDGGPELEEVLALAHQLEGEKRVLLDWDISMTERTMEWCTERLERVDLSPLHAIRLKDVGALGWFRSRKDIPCRIHLNLEGLAHNERSLLAWVRTAGVGLERVILSLELDRIRLERYLHLLGQRGIEGEILGLGPIPLFYSPRALLGGIDAGEMTQVWSEEERRRPFLALERERGTRLFLGRDLNLLEYAGELEAMGLGAFRVDINHLPQEVGEKIFSPLSQGRWDISYPRPGTLGFFVGNKTDALFKRLKNEHLPPREGNFVGEVRDTKRGAYTGFWRRHGACTLRVGDSFSMATPTGAIKRAKVSWLKNTLGQNLEETAEEGLFYLQGLSGASVGSRLYRVN